MEKLCGLFLIFVLPFIHGKVRLECGPNGFVCDGISKMRLCEDGIVSGPSFRCPSNTLCNEDSTEVCESTFNYIDPIITRNIRCHRNERLADPTVPGCKGYIVCIPNKNRFQGLKFQCSGKTVFNGFTRACTSPEKYKCPLSNGTNSNRLTAHSKSDQYPLRTPIECQNYKFAVTSDNDPPKVTYFCPQRPRHSENNIRCTVFSNNFCLALEKDDEDQFISGAGSAYRKPRININ